MQNKYFIDQSLCISCGTCDVGCNFKAIHVDENGKFSIIQDNCRGCGICYRDCPKDAVIKENNN